MKTLACYSNKGGVGKTTSSVNLAHAFAARGLRTLLVDLDPQGASSFYLRVKPAKSLPGDTFFTDARKREKAIRGSDFDNLDILPASPALRDADALLSGLKKSRSRLGRALAPLEQDYDLVLLDCPPNLSRLSENIFRLADAIAVPVIPSPLCERSFAQILDFFRAEDLPRRSLMPFFSMVQPRKRLHAETMERMRAAHGKRFLDTEVPFSAEIEKMGQHRAPVATFAPRLAASQVQEALADEITARLGLGPRGADRPGTGDKGGSGAGTGGA